MQIKDGRVLRISGERNVEKEDKNKTWHRVLAVTVPEKEVKKPDVKAIEISG